MPTTLQSIGQLKVNYNGKRDMLTSYQLILTSSLTYFPLYQLGFILKFNSFHNFALTLLPNLINLSIEILLLLDFYYESVNVPRVISLSTIHSICQSCNMVNYRNAMCRLTINPNIPQTQLQYSQPCNTISTTVQLIP